MEKRFGDQPLGLIGDVLRRHDRRGTYERLGHAAKQVILSISQRMMHDGSRSLGRHSRHADQLKDRQVFGISAGDSIDRAECAHPIGRAEGGHAFDTGIAICCIGRVELV